MTICHRQRGGLRISGLVELGFWLLAARTFPVFRQVLERNAVVLCRVIDISADGAHVLSGGFLLGEVHLRKDGRDGVVQIHHPLSFKVLISLRCVGAHVDCRMLSDELTDSVLCDPCFRQIVVDHRELVMVQSLVNIGDVTMDHVEQAIVLNNDYAVAVCVTLCLYVVDAIRDGLALREVEVCSVSEGYRTMFWIP